MRLFPCLSLHPAFGLGTAQLTARHRSQLVAFGENCDHWIPNFSTSRDLLFYFIYAEPYFRAPGPACIVLTQWNFLCGETYAADSLHGLKTDLFAKKTPLPLLRGSSAHHSTPGPKHCSRSALPSTTTGTVTSASPTLLDWFGRTDAESFTFTRLFCSFQKRGIA